jgi:hypothetical protein
MAYNESFATRVRDVLGEQPGLAEKKMFGGLAFLVDGNMACDVRGDDLIVRVAAEVAAAALPEPGTRLFDLTGRPMKDWLLVDDDGHAEDETCAAGSTGASPAPTPCRPSNHASVSGRQREPGQLRWRAIGRWLGAGGRAWSRELQRRSTRAVRPRS